MCTANEGGVDQQLLWYQQSTHNSLLHHAKGGSLKTMNLSITPYGFITSRIYVNMYSDISPVDVYS